jgi:hypothetical protein
MEIRLSQYRAPFSETPEPGVHYISLDDQADMKLGKFDAHVRLFNSLPIVRTIEAHNVLTNEHHVFELNPSFMPVPYAKEMVTIQVSEIRYLDDLAYKHKINAAQKRLSKLIFFPPTDVSLAPYNTYKNTSVKKQKRASKAYGFLHALTNNKHC